jgi:hypothetical protein
MLYSLSVYRPGRAGVPSKTTASSSRQLCQEMARLPKSDEAAANHAVDFELAIYNIWKQQTNSRLKPIAKAAALARIDINQLGCDRI